ncbi:Transcription factor IIA, alpha/beta subunit [Kalmanozyma brasiliensis GHG001]|uniref:Transcription initiation factor IIA large subunit n=1 Tax=Kalmanozyma brasiliensis (strain GHG001) TaxID=1365824 RepID=V5EZW9_KALBG|nr:Transcription factor IIA, alpha/beta subunit [Kalmanozyma brasiliensis GHG001]EST08479.1 Transcription factor IIA, alpha/beta subunit [Kalmanozyma brasiliensis GHG001]
MSNKVVSQVYRTIIDDVINNVRQDFEEMGIEKEVLEELQRSWEAKIVATQVAEFEGAPALPPAKSRSSKKPDPKSDVKSEDSKPANGDAHRSKAARADGASDVAGASSTQGSSTDATKKEEEDDDTAAGQKRKRISDDDEIGSDLDDSDDEDLDGGADGDNDDMVLCLYDKVQRVKNKWKCVLKDGVASIDGRDYLFAKCNGEFEW